MSVRFYEPGTVAALVVCSMLATACVHRPAANTVPGLVQKVQPGTNPLTDDSRIKNLEARIKTSPKDVAARLELASLYENYRAFDEALTHYTEVLLITGPKAPQEATAGLRRCSESSGRSAEAIPFLEAFLKTSPSMNGWNDLALLHDGVGNHAAAEQGFREALALNPESERMHNNLGYNLLQQGNREGAEREYRTALDLNPKFAPARNNLGVLLARGGNLQGALEQFELAADAPTAHNNLAVVLLEAGLYEQSREEVVKALEIRQYFAPALENLKLLQERMREQATSKN